LKTIRLALILLFFIGFNANADDLQFIISGKAIHLGGPANLNENNRGFGLQYDFNPQRNWIPLLNIATFKDSNDKTSKYVGAGIKRRFKFFSSEQRVNFDAGILALAMTRRYYNDGQPFYGAIPFVSLSNNWGGINATYVPSIEEGTFPFWYFQLSVKLMEF